MSSSPQIKIDFEKSFFILGSGFSKAVSEQMPLTNELNSELSDKGSDGMGFLNEYFSFEDALTYLASDHPFIDRAEFHRNRAKFFEITDEICNILTLAQNSAAKTLSSIEWFMKLVAHWHKSQTPIITFNYDNVVELALLQLSSSKDANDLGFKKKLSATDLYQLPLVNAYTRGGGAIIWGSSETRERTIALYKLHGSLNWYYSGNEDFSGEPIYHNPYLLDADSSSRTEAIYLTRDQKTLIIPPILAKTDYFNHESLKSQWTLAQLDMADSNCIFILGYSFPKEDLAFRSFLIRTLDINRTDPSTIVVVNKDGIRAKQLANQINEFMKSKIAPEKFLCELVYFDGNISEFATSYTTANLNGKVKKV